MHELVIRLKSGREFTVICEGCSLTRDVFGQISNIHFEGLQNIKPLILDPSQIELMYEVLQPAEERVIKDELEEYQDLVEALKNDLKA